MKIFAMDDYKRVISSEAYQRACMNYQFNMLENSFTAFGGVVQHCIWTNRKVKEWHKECPQEYSSKQYNEWLERKFKEYKKRLGINK